MEPTIEAGGERDAIWSGARKYERTQSLKNTREGSHERPAAHEGRGK